MKLHETRRKVLQLLLVACLLALTAAPGALAAYRSHGNDKDVDNFLAAYPQAVNSALDDCYLCHPGGKVDGKAKGSCDFCHGTYGLKEPHGQLPLNQFGKDYLTAGRSVAAFSATAGLDSDGDGYVNEQEIGALTNPGEPGDKPGLKQPPAVMLTPSQIRALPVTEQFMLMNTTKSGDSYCTYRGVSLPDLLAKVGISPAAKSVTIYSPDGFATDFALDDIMRPFPKGVFYAGLPWVEYPAGVKYKDGEIIPDNLKVTLVYERDGKLLDTGRLIRSGDRWVLDGEGPYRVVIPQVVQGPPDRASNAEDKDAQPYPYLDSADHNAGFSVRSVVAIRVNPLPPGTVDFNWREGGWNMVQDGQLIVYGALK